VPRAVRRPTAALLVGGLLLSGAACTKKDKPKPDPVARDFLAALAAGDPAKAATFTDGEPGVVVREYTDAVKDLGLTSTLTLGDVQTTGAAATAAYRATRKVTGFADWSYDGQVRLALGDKKQWRVVWEPAVIHPRLQAGMRLDTTRSMPPRGDLLDAAGEPLFTEQETVRIGIQPDAFTEARTALPIIARETGVDAKRLAAKIAAAKSNAFVEVITLRRPDYEKIKPKIHPLKGVRFVEGKAVLAPSATFARALLGRVGVATAEQLAKAGPEFKPGDVLGQGGLQGAFQERLSGTPTGRIVGLIGEDVVETLHEYPGIAPEPVRTTIDRRFQQAAEDALGSLKTPAALVAVRASTGEVVAVANRPSDLALNRAFEGRYPPGSTFKVISAAALLAGGLKPDDVVRCPQTINAGGKVFRNFEGEQAGAVPFSTDFAHSCNTAFVSLADRLDPDAFTVLAPLFGLGGGWKLPVPAYAGSVPKPRDETELAATMIGQGRLLASPLAMALVAAAVADGTARSPVLVTEPADDGGGSSTQLDQASLKIPVDDLRALMREVVTDGTGKKAEAPGGVSGKTGTAEFGAKAPFNTHAWFIGFSGDIAVSVIVEGDIPKRSGGKDAAPIAGRFFRAIA
jgi:cell division protein FtsI/penicillin-binding protein 2